MDGMWRAQIEERTAVPRGALPRLHSFRPLLRFSILTYSRVEGGNCMGTGIKLVSRFQNMDMKRAFGDRLCDFVVHQLLH